MRLKVHLGLVLSAIWLVVGCAGGSGSSVTLDISQDSSGKADLVVEDDSGTDDGTGAETRTEIKQSCSVDDECLPPGSCQTGSCVEGTCVFEVVAGKGCDDGDLCTTEDSCLESGECAGTAVECGDDDLCNGEESCDPATGECVAGQALEVDDGVACSVDGCDPATGEVTHTPDDSACADENPCTADLCSLETGCSNDITVGAQCNDDDLCSVDDSCQDDGTCAGAAKVCDDGLACNGVESCDAETGDCVADVPPEVDDGVECTDDTCDDETGEVFHQPNNVLCDDENPCTQDSCDPVEGCLNVAMVGAGCDDGDLCTASDQCTDTGVCEGQAVVCDDQLFCNGQEVCNPETGLCLQGIPPTLSDGVDCTVDSCDEATGAVVHTRNDDLCDDQNPCTVDLCSPTVGCSNLAVLSQSCNDSDPCTVQDQCTATGECVGTPKVCDDQSFCNGLEVCDSVTGNCVATLVPDVDDDIECTIDGCNDATDEVTHTPDSTVCQDNNPCTQDSCDPEAGCVHVTNQGALCDDSDPCTTGDVCDFEGKCSGVPRECADDLFCNGVEVCDGGTGECVPGTPLVLDDEIACTLDGCDEDLDTIVHVPDNTECDDGDICTADVCHETTGCSNGVVVNKPCNDGDLCTTEDACSDSGICVGTTKACNDGLFCNGEESCDSSTGDCLDGAAPVVDDGIGCTQDSCNEDTDTVLHEADSTWCDDGNICTADVCVAGLGCRNNAVVGKPCDDGSACTVNDQCSDQGLCQGFSEDCDDGAYCNGIETCDSLTGDCLPGPAPIVDDGVSCTSDSCDEVDDEVHHLPDDAQCNDSNPCTLDVCDVLLGCTHTPLTGQSCDDADLCTFGDACGDDGVCAGVQVGCADPFFCDGEEFCDPATGDCTVGFVPQDNVDDGIDCTNDYCDEELDAIVHEADHFFCDDGNVCTSNTCNVEAGCVNPPLSGPPCDDGDVCTTGDVCVFGSCVPGEYICGEICGNGVDDNNNGAVDCADTGCRFDETCLGESCWNPFVVTETPVTADDSHLLLSFTGDTRLSADDHEASCHTGTQQAPDDVYRLVLDVEAQVTATFDFDTDYWYPALSLFDGNCGAGNEIGCDYTTSPGGPAVISQLLAPGTYFFVVDAAYTTDEYSYWIEFEITVPSTTETDCSDGIDNDVNGSTDCCDAACTGDPACLMEGNCGDLMDNDCDGAVDCCDEDCNGDSQCAAESDCTDGVDNDCDGLFDCDDADCLVDDVCMGESCDNPFLVNDGLAIGPEQDGVVFTLTGDTTGRESDLSGSCDSATAQAADEAWEFVLSQEAYVTISYDFTESYNYPALVLFSGACSPAGEMACDFTKSGGGPAVFEGVLNAGVYYIGADAAYTSDDGPYTIELVAAMITATETGCGDGFDNDQDGWLDCCDSDCDSAAECQTETNCSDGLDNDCDGAFDCCDVNCKSQELCTAEVGCNDGVDNDCDGKKDCLDTDCSSLQICTGESCLNPLLVNDGVSIGAMDDGAIFNYNGTTTGSQASYTTNCAAGSAGAPDNVYSFTLDVVAQVTMTQSFGSAYDYPTMYLYGTTCVPASQIRCNNGGYAKAAVIQEVLDPGTYYAVFDASYDYMDGPYSGQFTIMIPTEAETVCDDGVDNDLDEFFDCCDSDCDGAIQCGAETQCNDDVDNDCDGTTDCEDSDCNGDSACAGESCVQPLSVNGGDTIFAADLGSVFTYSGTLLDTVDYYQSACQSYVNGGGDRVYMMDLGVEAAIHVELTQDLGNDVPVLLLYDGQCVPGSELVCDKPSSGGVAAVVDHTLPAGVYYVVVDCGDWDGQCGGYGLSISVLAP